MPMVDLSNLRPARASPILDRLHLPWIEILRLHRPQTAGLDGWKMSGFEVGSEGVLTSRLGGWGIRGRGCLVV